MFLIVAGSIDEMFRVKDPMVECLAIVHSCKPGEIPINARQVAQLAPSDELFHDYRYAMKNGLFTDEWFKSVYVLRFLRDISKNEEAKRLLRNLCMKSYNHDIFIGCFCENPRLCHRTIVANLLMGLGANISGYDERWEYHYGMFKDYITST